MEALARQLNPRLGSFLFRLDLKKHNIKSEYTILEAHGLLHHLENSDCKAVTWSQRIFSFTRPIYDDQILYTMYTQHRLLRDNVLNRIIREEIFNPAYNSFLDDIKSNQADGILCFWFGAIPNNYMLQLEYDAASEQFRAVMWCTEEYKQGQK